MGGRHEYCGDLLLVVVGTCIPCALDGFQARGTSGTSRDVASGLLRAAAEWTVCQGG